MSSNETQLHLVKKDTPSYLSFPEQIRQHPIHEYNKNKNYLLPEQHKEYYHLVKQNKQYTQDGGGNNIVTEIAQAAKNAADNVGEEITTAANKVGEAAENIINDATVKTVIIADGIGNKLNKIIGKTGGAGKKYNKFTEQNPQDDLIATRNTQSGQGLPERITAAANGVGSQITAAVNNVGSKVTAAASDVGQELTKAADDVKQVITNTADDVIQDVADQTASVTEGVKEEIIKAADNVGEVTADVTNGIGNELKKIIEKTGGADKNSKSADNAVLKNKIKKLRTKIKKYRYTIKKNLTGGTKIQKTTIPKFTKKNKKTKDNRTNHHAKTTIPHKINNNNEKYYECPHCFKIFSHAPAFIQHSKRCSKKPSDWDETKYFKPIS